MVYTNIENELKETLWNDLLTTKVYSLTDAATSYDPTIRAAGSGFGVYLLFLGSELVYIGKVSGKTLKLRGRMRHHLKKINCSWLNVADVKCNMICIPSKILIPPCEELLIRHYNPPWNGMDFGGMFDKRDEDYRVKPSKWASKYIINDELGQPRLTSYTTLENNNVLSLSMS